MAFVRAFEKLSEFRGEAAFRTWLFRIAINLALNHVRGTHADLAPLGDVASFTTSLQTSRLVAAEVWRKVSARLDDLPPKQRLALELRIFHDLSFDEIAVIAGFSVQSAKANYHHAVKRLRGPLARRRVNVTGMRRSPAEALRRRRPGRTGRPGTPRDRLECRARGRGTRECTRRWGRSSSPEIRSSSTRASRSTSRGSVRRRRRSPGRCRTRTRRSCRTCRERCNGSRDRTSRWRRASCNTPCPARTSRSRRSGCRGRAPRRLQVRSRRPRSRPHPSGIVLPLNTRHPVTMAHAPSQGSHAPERFGSGRSIGIPSVQIDRGVGAGTRGRGRRVGWAVERSIAVSRTSGRAGVRRCPRRGRRGAGGHHRRRGRQLPSAPQVTRLDDSRDCQAAADDQPHQRAGNTTTATMPAREGRSTNGPALAAAPRGAAQAPRRRGVRRRPRPRRSTQADRPPRAPRETARPWGSAGRAGAPAPRVRPHRALPTLRGRSRKDRGSRSRAR